MPKKTTTPPMAGTEAITTPTGGEGANAPTPPINEPSMNDPAASAEPDDQQSGDAANSGEKEPEAAGDLAHRSEDDGKESGDPEKMGENEFLNPEDLTEQQKADAIEMTPELLDMLGRLIDHYPQEKAFHFTSDGQPFLEKNLAEAKAHQLTIDPNTTVETFNVD